MFYPTPFFTPSASVIYTAQYLLIITDIILYIALPIM